MSPLNLIKMHGCGNDYLFVDCFTQTAPADPAALSRRLSDRHTGIGSDGLVLMCPPVSPESDALMEIFNADGSRGGMCGNALRCFALWLKSSQYTDSTMTIQMDQRLVTGSIHSMSTDGMSGDVEVSLGQPELMQLSQNAGSDNVLAPDSSCPSGGSQKVSPRTISSSVQLVRPMDLLCQGRPISLHCLSMGNPHAVHFVEILDSIEFLRLGPIIERHELFPDRTNVEFVTVRAPNEARVRVWERGSGETRACGSGACAVAVAGISAGWFSESSPVRILMNGGQLTVRLTQDDQVLLRGEAVRIADITVTI